MNSPRRTMIYDFALKVENTTRSLLSLSYSTNLGFGYRRNSTWGLPETPRTIIERGLSHISYVSRTASSNSHEDGHLTVACKHCQASFTLEHRNSRM